MNDRLKALLQPETTVTPAQNAQGADSGADRDEPAAFEEGCAGWFRGARERAIALEFCLLSGPWPAPDYALVKCRWWEEGEGFTVEYVSGMKVVVRGWGLRRVYDLFLRNRLYRLTEQGKDPVREKQERAVRGDRASWVHSIRVELPREEGA